MRVANSFVADPPSLSPEQDANDAGMVTTLSEREQGFNDGLQVAIDYFKNCAAAIGNIDASAHRTALLIMVAAYQSDLRGLQKRGDAEMQAAFDAETRRSA
jgi:hypothetical protein